ncbi:MAG: hypothetical protein IJS74_00985, partial [Clostridia bacterium]|nr:hypothetical protein [Clostridia bacterium]
KKEKEALGIYLSGHPLTPYISLLQNMNFNSSMIKDMNGEEENAEEDEEMLEDEQVSQSDLEDGMRVKAIGVITEIKKLFTKVGNKPMAVVRIEDLYGSVEVMVFNKFWEEYKDRILEDAIVIVDGRLSIRDGERPIIIMDKFEFLDENSSEEEETHSQEKIVFNDIQEQEKPKRLYMQFDIENEDMKNKVFEILGAYPGKTDTFVQFNKKLYSLNHKVDDCPAIISELNVLLGEKNIKLI